MGGMAPPISHGLRPVTQPDPAQAKSREAAEIHGKLQQRRTERMDFDYRWWTAYDWYKGRTSHFYIPGPPGRAGRIVERTYMNQKQTKSKPLNLFAHAIDLVIAKQMKARPVPTCKPGPNPRNRMQARAVKSLLLHLFTRNQLVKRRRELLLARALTGNAFVKVYFDPLSTIGPFVDNMQSCPACYGQGKLPLPPEVQAQNQQLAQMAQMSGMPPPPAPPPCSTCQGKGKVNANTLDPSQPTRRALGEVRIEIIPPWQVYPINSKGRIEDGVYHSFMLTKDECQARWGNLPTFDPATLKAYGEWEEGKSHFEQQRDVQLIAEQEPNKVRVIEVWEPPAPGTECPILTIVVGNQIVVPRGAVKERYHRVPWFHFRLRPMDEAFFAETYSIDMIDANDSVNRSRNNFDRHEALMAVAKWMVQIGSVDKKQLTNRVAEIVDYRGEKPTIQSGTPMPDWLFRKYEDEGNKVFSLAGLQDIDRGIPPPNVEAHSALFFLAEQSEQIHGPVLVDDEATWTEIYETSFICAQTNYGEDEKRWMSLVGDPHQLEVKAIKEPDLVQSSGITCEIGGALVQSTALRQAALFEGETSGLFTRAGISGRDVVRAAEFGNLVGEDFTDHQQQDELAQYENEMLANPGYFHEATSMHDHDVHIACHRVAAAIAAAEGNPQLAAALTQAIDAHMMAKGREAAIAAGQMPMAPPAAPGSPSMMPGQPAPFDGAPPMQLDTVKAPMQDQAPPPAL